MALGRTRLWAVLQILCFFTLQTRAIDILGTRGGVKPNGERPARRDLEQFQHAGPPFDIFILALLRYQDLDQSREDSYFNAASVHGLPFREWDGVQGSGNSGYCAHGSTIFPTWHRPYLAFYEKGIWDQAQIIAKEYPQDVRNTYIEAALNLRIPYWDYGLYAKFPACVVTPEIEVTTPQGRQRVRNPLYSSRISPTAQKGFPMNDIMSPYQWTVRYPDSRGQSQSNLVQSNLMAQLGYFRQTTYQLFASQDTFAPFSTMAYRNRFGQEVNNIEMPHGAAHNLAGGTRGHMTYIAWSAYDPCFFLLHANVDRILAIWQTIYYKSWVTPLAAGENTYVIRRGEMLDGNTPLKPFHSRNQAFWTSNTARFTRTFGYTYEGLIDWVGTQEEQAAEARKYVNRLYNNPSRQNQKRSLRSKKKRSFDFSAVLAKGFDFIDALGNLAAIPASELEELGINNQKKQYSAEVTMDMFAIKDPFNLYFFLGEPPENPNDWDTAPNSLAAWLPYSHSEGNPENEVNIMKNLIPLDTGIVKAQESGVIKELSDKLVAALLKSQLTWTVRCLNGSAVDTAQFVRSSSGDGPALRVTILSRDVQPIDASQMDKFPTYGEWHDLEATKDKVGGSEGKDTPKSY